MSVLKIIMIVIVLIVGIVSFTLYRNDANLFQEPGFAKRLTIFLTTSGAATADNHPFKELRTPVYDLSAELLYKRVIEAATKLGWVIVVHDSDNQDASFVVRSPILLFEDDVYVQVQFIEMNKSSLYIQSSSHKGGADFAAGSGYIQALINHIKNNKITE